jgi:S1-C subfamily serine protease
MKNFLFIFSIFIILTGCKTTGTVIQPSYATGTENIKHNLERNKIDIFEAYVEANKYLSKLDATSDKYEDTKKYIQGIKDEIDTDAKNLYDEKKYKEASLYTLSLNSMGMKPSVSTSDVFNKFYDSLDNTTDIFTRNKYREQMIDLGVSSNREIYDFIKYYYDQKSSGFFIYFYNKYTKLYPSLLKDFPELEKYFNDIKTFSSLNLENMMDSVVTVIVKKGLTFKNGMAYYDNTIGTGFFIDDNGYLLTNHHVIADIVNPKFSGAASLYVTMRDDPDTEIPATVVGYDKVFDIALLRIPKKNSKHLVIGRSLDMKIGDKVYTIGNPFGISYVVTSGIMGNKEIEFFQLGKGFQIDAAINPGNSGGPLIDEKGQVIGIVFAGLDKGMSEGINFAIPFQSVIKTIPYLYKGGEVKRCWIGGALYDDKNKTSFYYILPNGPLDKAGIKTGDVLKKIDTSDVASTEEAQNILSWQDFPRLVKLEVERNGVVMDFMVRPEERPYLPVIDAFKKDTQGKLITLIFGIDLEYFDNPLFYKKYKVTKVYRKMFGQKLEINEGDVISVRDLSYSEKDNRITFIVKFKKKDYGFFERELGLQLDPNINTLL